MSRGHTFLSWKWMAVLVTSGVVMRLVRMVRRIPLGYHVFRGRQAVPNVLLGAWTAEVRLVMSRFLIKRDTRLRILVPCRAAIGTSFKRILPFGSRGRQDGLRLHPVVIAFGDRCLNSEDAHTVSLGWAQSGMVA